MTNSKKAMVPFLALHVDRRSPIPLQRQLFNCLRDAILAGRLAPGVRLPATRVLSADLGVSRNTVVGAFDQLLAEGYLEGKVGSGTYVARQIPEQLLRVGPPKTADAGPAGPPLRLSRRGQYLAGIRVSLNQGVALPRPFRPGLPAFDQFPRALWTRLAARLLRRVPAATLTYGDAAGYFPLRQAIAEYLGGARGVICSAGQVVVTSGTQQALDLAARLLLDPGDTAWVEDPGYLGARAALMAAGARCAPVPVDSQGISVESGSVRAPNARLVCVTPLHQYPLGLTMPVARRMELLAWAGRRRAWIVEDDYDSEYRYAGRPLAALQGLDPGRVIYTGSFSKVLFPGLRLGYLVAPAPLVDAFVSARALADRQPPGIEQVVLAEFLAEGHFARHVRRMRALYAERQEVLLAAMKAEASGLIDARPAETGLQVVGWLPRGADDRSLSEKAAASGIIAPPLTAYAMRARVPPGLILGYACLAPRQIRDGVRQLVSVLHSGRK